MYKKIVKYSLYILTIFLIAYSCVWFYVAHRIKSIITDDNTLIMARNEISKHLQQQTTKYGDIEITSADIKTGGYPWNIKFTIDDLILKSKEEVIKIPEVKLKFNIYKNKISANVDEITYSALTDPENKYIFYTNADIDLKFNKHFLYLKDRESIINEIRDFKYSDNLSTSSNISIEAKDQINITRKIKDKTNEFDVEFQSKIITNGINNTFIVDMKVINLADTNTLRLEIDKIEISYDDIAIATKGNLSYQRGEMPRASFNLQLKNYDRLFDVVQQSLTPEVMEKNSALMSMSGVKYEELMYILNMIALSTIKDIMLQVANKVTDDEVSIDIALAQSGECTIGTKSVEWIINELLESMAQSAEYEDSYDADDDYDSDYDETMDYYSEDTIEDYWPENEYEFDEEFDNSPYNYG